MSESRDILKDLISLLQGLMAARQLCDALGWDWCLPALLCVMALIYLQGLFSEAY